MRSTDVRRRCRKRLDELRHDGLEVPDPFDGTELVQRVARCMGHPINLVGIRMPVGAPYGLTFFTAEQHIIAFEARTNRLHRDLIIVHELAHIILGHRPIPLDDNAAARQLLPSLSPTLVSRVLTRAGAYDRADEQEAETMATLMLQDSGQHDSDADLAGLAPEDAALCNRLAESFEKPR